MKRAWQNFAIQVDLYKASSHIVMPMAHRISLKINNYNEMKANFSLDYWDHLKPILKREFPQLTNADLFWRHETKDDLFRMIATKLGKTQKQFEEAIDTLDHFH